MDQQKTELLPRPKLNRHGYVGEVISTMAFAAAIFILLQLAMPRSIVHGRSMQPSFEEGQRLVISRINYLFGQPQHGDIIVFNSPKPRTDNEPALIKRVIGIPGDLVEMIDYQVYLNGQLLDEPYIKEPCTVRRCSDNSWQLGPDEYFMMGDNRNVSNDSRAFGPVPKENIVGEVLVRFWPIQSIGIVSQYRFPGDN